ncbi:NAD(P)/FAD-dependent oxidoreductase [Paraburkholderia solisilvae]|uniref:Gamma-glutamylputrescine oxidoreductase n=1 Tax=Paraburkholderia solisilvae TaxID=624376 RepID=A0A6J5DA36_9BURK|nr:FAD-binding oxidoreductase [Paraburkholderia solisilvae]CAB3750264.1 Gamma-glutamylputrescine oxidoreductase [Paraburkholderia solisilvae]
MQSFYEATVKRPERLRLTGRHSAHVCIVGGGLAGLSTALGLAERGLRDVVVLEAQQVGFGASGRNGGFVFGGYSLDCADLLKVLGAARARELYALTTDAVDLMRKRIRRYNIDCDVTDAGVILANWFDEPARLDAQRRLMKESFGVDWEPLGERELSARLKTNRYHGGLFERNAFHFHPLKYVAGIAAAAADAGVRIHEHSPVRALRAQRGGFVVDTPMGTVDAQHVVMAGGGYARNVYRRVERAVLPIATYVMATEPLGARLKDAIDCTSAVYDTRFAFDYYRPLPDTRILWGGRISIVERAPQAIARLLRGDLLKVYPQLHGVRVDYAWGGLMSYARHKMPQIGRSTDGVWYAVGFGGHGMAPTTACGELLAAAITGERPVPEAFAQFGLAHTFGAFGLAAAQLTYAAMQTRDAIAARRRAVR